MIKQSLSDKIKDGIVRVLTLGRCRYINDKYVESIIFYELPGNIVDDFFQDVSEFPGDDEK